MVHRGIPDADTARRADHDVFRGARVRSEILLDTLLGSRGIHFDGGFGFGKGDLTTSRTRAAPWMAWLAAAVQWRHSIVHSSIVSVVRIDGNG